MRPLIYSSLIPKLLLLWCLNFRTVVNIKCVSKMIAWEDLCFFCGKLLIYVMQITGVISFILLILFTSLLFFGRMSRFELLRDLLEDLEPPPDLEPVDFSHPFFKYVCYNVFIFHLSCLWAQFWIFSIVHYNVLFYNAFMPNFRLFSCSWAKF